MRRTTYRYNKESCKFEPHYANGKVIFTRISVFLSISLVCAIAAFMTYRSSFDSVQELWLKKKNETLRMAWYLLDKRVLEASNELKHLSQKDDNNYRIILDSNPLPPSVREAGTGGSVKIETQGIRQYDHILNTYKKIDKLKRQVDVEVQSLKEIASILSRKAKMWASRPAIQPIDNRQLDRLHLTYGPRFHPIHKRMMDHNGLDFTAPKGTPIYATGDGRVNMAYFSVSYGNVVYVDHGYGFETRYAHLSKFAVKQGQVVKRGQVIGYVGNTGTSVSDHLHYEVLVNGKHTNPINFFQRDFNNKEYRRLIQQASDKTTPLDY